jgi:hypothetical protein
MPRGGDTGVHGRLVQRALRAGARRASSLQPIAKLTDHDEP